MYRDIRWRNQVERPCAVSRLRGKNDDGLDLRWLQKCLTKLELKQEQGFNWNRQHAINRLRAQLMLMLMAVEDGARPAVGRKRIKANKTEDALASTSTTGGWPLTKRDTISAAVNLQRVNTNKTEQEFATRALARGWSVTKRGWPDFLCWKGDDVAHPRAF